LPEYNGSFPGILKSFIDCIKPAHFAGKKIALVGVSDGHAGGLRPLDQMTAIFHHIKTNVYFDKPKLSSIESNFDTEDKMTEVYLNKLKKQMEGFLKF
jgi:NAD(P)H-dependent FMN reductase